MYPKPYIDYLYHFHCDRDYFECHEILEEHWKEETNLERNYWVGLIQIAVALYHHRRGNMTGAKRMLKSAISIITKEPNALDDLGLDVSKLIHILEMRLDDLNNNRTYTSINLPIKDEKLLTKCISISEQRGQQWGLQSNLTNEAIIHKHKLRDRSEVINEREKQKKLKQEKGQR